MSSDQEDPYKYSDFHPRDGALPVTPPKRSPTMKIDEAKELLKHHADGHCRRKGLGGIRRAIGVVCEALEAKPEPAPIVRKWDPDCDRSRDCSPGFCVCC